MAEYTAEYVTKINQEKVDSVDYVKSRFADSPDLVFTDYRGLTVGQITDLRGRLREKGADYRVMKNKRVRIALQQLELPDASEYLVGPTAVAISRTESGPVVKELIALGKDMPLALKGAIIDGRIFTAAQVAEFSKLPTRDELLSKLMGTMKAPVQNLAIVLNAVPQKLVRTLAAVAEQKQAG
ncbi:MAG: 50S ribosomal protein L10 [Spirochaetaceae bacterium]|nr:MAG: 50S ribosomal protein L10 [Spirochaetaceae bacterium]